MRSEESTNECVVSILVYSAQQSQTKSLASCIAKGTISKDYAMESGFHNASSHREAYGQGSYTADQKLLQPG